MGISSALACLPPRPLLTLAGAVAVFRRLGLMVGLPVMLFLLSLAGKLGDASIYQKLHHWSRASRAGGSLTQLSAQGASGAVRRRYKRHATEHVAQTQALKCSRLSGGAVIISGQRCTAPAAESRQNGENHLVPGRRCKWRARPQKKTDRTAVGATPQPTRSGRLATGHGAVHPWSQRRGCGMRDVAISVVTAVVCELRDADGAEGAAERPQAGVQVVENWPDRAGPFAAALL